MGISRRSSSIFKSVVQLGLSFNRLWSALESALTFWFSTIAHTSRGRVTDRDLCQRWKEGLFSQSESGNRLRVIFCPASGVENAHFKMRYRLRFR